MQLEMKVHEVVGLGNGMVRLVLIRRGLKARIERIPRTEEQRVAESITKQIQQAFGGAFPGAVIVGSPFSSGESWDARVVMEITEEEYAQFGKPSLNDIIQIDAQKSADTSGLDEQKIL